MKKIEPLPIMVETPITISQIFNHLNEYLKSAYPHNEIISLCETEQNIASTEISLFLDYVQDQLYNKENS